MKLFKFTAIAALCMAAASAASAASAQENVLNLYSARHYQTDEALYSDFTKQTGIKINRIEAGEDALIARVKSEGERSPADVLITVDAGNLWNAARNGLLAKVESPALTANVPAHLRDPEGRWFGLTVRARTIMYSTARVKPAELSTYEALGEPKWKNRLCLRSSNYIYNQSLLGAWIKRSGEPKVEQIVRGWVANNPILINGDTKILEAIAAGQCDVGITNTYYLAQLVHKEPGFPVAPFWADQQGAGTHVNISGAGVTAHAKNREAAIKLLEYLSSVEAQNLFADSNFEYPANPKVKPHGILLKWGPFKEDDINVAAAGESQAAATKLSDRVGYK